VSRLLWLKESVRLFWGKITNRGQAHGRAVWEAEFKKYGGHRQLYTGHDEALPLKAYARRRSVEKRIAKLHASLGEPNDSQG
jgi:hypothetical protein